MGIGEGRLARLHQVHGCAVAVAGQADSGALPSADIIVSAGGDSALAIQTADCVPILLADSASGAVAAAHAGWRGLAARVPEAAVRALNQHAGTAPRNIVAAVGPAISAVRYEVGSDVRERFEAGGFSSAHIDAWFPAVTRPGHWLFDGWGSARDQLIAAGVPATRVHVAALCTATHPDLLCSYRRDGSRAGRMAAAIASLT